MVSASVARATDGAAPKRAAKLLGLKTVPRIEKVETKKPPTKKRIRITLTGRSPWVDRALSGGQRADVAHDARDFRLRHNAIDWDIFANQLERCGINIKRQQNNGSAR
jgi:hypothetical protein